MGARISGVRPYLVQLLFSQEQAWEKSVRGDVPPLVDKG